MVNKKDLAIKIDLADAYLHSPIHHSLRVPKIQLSRPVLPVESHVLWSHVSSLSFYKGSSSDCGTSSHAQYSASCLFGRFNEPKSKQNGLVTGSSHMPASFTSLGFILNLKKSSLIAQQLITYIGAFFNMRDGQNFSDGRKGFKGQRSNRQFLTKTSNCKILSPSPGSDGFLHRTSSQCSSPYDTNSFASSEFLEAFQRFSRNGSSLYSASFGSSEMVVSSSKHLEGSIFKTSSDDSYNHYRCSQVNVWRAHRKVTCRESGQRTRENCI